MDFSGLKPEEKQALMEGRFDDVPDDKLMGLVNPPPSLGHQAADAAVGGLEHVGKGLDYLGGAVRTGAAKLMGVSKPGETLDALNPLSKNTAPSSSEIMGRLGVPEGAKLSDYLHVFADPANKGNAWYRPVKGGMLDPSVRGTIGTGLDIASDPLTYLTMGGTGAEKALAKEAELATTRGNLNRTMSDTLKSGLDAMTAKTGAAGLPLSPVTRPLSNAMDYIGTKMYRSGLQPLDKEMAESGKTLISPRLMNEGAIGGWQSIDQHMLDQSKEFKTQAQGIASKMDALDPVTKTNAELTHYGDMYGSDINREITPEISSGGVDMGTAMDKGRAANAKLGDRPILAPVQSAMGDMLNSHSALGNVPRSHAIQLKSDLYSTLPQSAFDMAARTEPGAGVRSQMALGLREASERGGTPELDALGQQLHDVNGNWGQNLTAQDTAGRLAGREMARPLATQVDMALAAKTLVDHGGPAAPLLWGKKIQQIMRATPFKTSAGWGLNKLSDLAGPGLDAMARQKLLDDTNRAQSPWALINPAQVGGQ